MQGGILSIDVAPDNENLLATAGADSVVVVFDREASRIRASLAGHSKKINSTSTASLTMFFLAHVNCIVYVHGVP